MLAPTPVAGIDVGKSFLDLGFEPAAKSLRVRNDPAGIAALIEALRRRGTARVALNLTGDVDGIARETVLTTPDAWHHTEVVDVRLRPGPGSGDAAPPLAPQLHVGAADVAVRHRPLGDPRWRGADLFLSLRNILPDRYPLDGITLAEILALENYAGRLIDYGVIVPRLQALYGWAAADLGEPRLLGLIRDGLPAYAWTNDERHPWTPVRGRRIIPVLTWLTS